MYKFLHLNKYLKIAFYEYTKCIEFNWNIKIYKLNTQQILYIL